MKRRISVMLLMVMFFSSFVLAQNNPEINKQIVTSFYDLAVNQHYPVEAAQRYMGNYYIQHNPLVANGAKAFIDYFTALQKKFPNAHGDIKRVIAAGDLVVLHVHSVLNEYDAGRAIVDIFRLENGKIVEHWDVIQRVTKESANGNSMF